LLGLAEPLAEAEELTSEFRGYRECTAFSGKIAIVGFGKMGALHATILKMLSPESEITVVEKSRLIRRGASTFLKDVRFYGELNEMLEKEEPDIVYVTSPAVTHFALLSKLASSSDGSIFVEKPPTRDSKQLVRVLGAMGSKRVAMVGLQKRYALPFRHLKRLVDSDRLGAVESVEASIESSDVLVKTARFDDLERGSLLDLGVHVLDLVGWLFGRVTVVQASACSIHTRLDDEVNAELADGRGAKVNLHVMWSSQQVRWLATRILVRGSRGVAEATEDTLRLGLNGDQEHLVTKPIYYRDSPLVNLADPEFTFEDMHLLCCVNGGREPETSLTGCASTMTLIDEIYAKMQFGKPDTHRR